MVIWLVRHPVINIVVEVYLSLDVIYCRNQWRVPLSFFLFFCNFMTLLIMMTIRTHQFDWFSCFLPYCLCALSLSLCISDIILLMDRFSPCYNWSREDNVLDKASELDWPLMITDGCCLRWSRRKRETVRHCFELNYYFFLLVLLILFTFYFSDFMSS